MKQAHLLQPQEVRRTLTQTSGTHDDEAGSSSPLKRTRVSESVEEAMLGRVHHEFMFDVIEEMLEIKVYEIGGDEVLFTSKAWRRAFDINEPIYTELCYEFYATYEFKEEVTDEELTSKKLIKFILRGRAHSLTILKFASRLGYDKVQRYELWLMSMFGARNREGYANVAWLIAKWMKRKGVGTQKESMICCGQFVTKIAKRVGVLTEEVLNGLSAPTYYRLLDATTLRELIGSNERLIAEDPAFSVPRVAMPRPPRLTM
ncbi:hypothetical protein Tco_0606078 [Tanacetum coccineum]